MNPPPPTEFTDRLRAAFRWVDPGPTSSHLVSDAAGWWRDPEILAGLGPALAAPFRAARPTVVISPATTGLLLGPLAATALGVGFVTARKDDPDGRAPAAPTSWAQSPPDFRGRRIRLGIGTDLLTPTDRVLVVDDWVATGAQLRAVYQLCVAAGAEPLGAAAVVTAAPPEVNQELRVRALLDAAEL